jgi:aspartyl-tRNA(Asn)/glutamyl-tRNA(Gln) amidotransferase subunit B
VLPVLNRQALALALRVCGALRCKANDQIYFERKNYFYPDLPKNYQISQYKMPLGHQGYVELAGAKRIRVNRVHMEEDAGKLLHWEDCSLVDFNRTGTPLLEIVSEPDINSAEEAFEYLNLLKLILQYIGASDCDMEKGSLRCDANISLKKKEVTKLGTKVELKNMNTFKGVRAALLFEAKRQEQVLEKGERVFQETRLWDADSAKTIVMRTKEEAHDYRYFPEPDLLDFSVPAAMLEKETAGLGELPLAKRKRFLAQYGLPEQDVDVFIAMKWLADFFETVVKSYPKAKEVSNWLLGPFLENVNALEGAFAAVAISPENFARIVQYFVEGRLNNLAAKKVLALSLRTNDDIDVIIEREKLTQVSDAQELISFVETAISENPKAIEEYKQGKDRAIQFLVGQVMKKTKGKANPGLVQKMLKEQIKGG